MLTPRRREQKHTAVPPTNMTRTLLWATLTQTTCQRYASEGGAPPPPPPVAADDEALDFEWEEEGEKDPLEE